MAIMTDKKDACNHDAVSSRTGGLYGRSENMSGLKRTYIHGMRQPGTENAGNSVSVSGSRVLDITLQSRPLAGVLYSVSRDACGELFPVYIGRNTIGSDPVSDIYLNEETVSASHAVLLIRSLPGDGGTRLLTMSLTDYDSAYGTEVNGVRLGYDRMPLKGNEIIRIGRSYFFLFIPIDPVPYGLGEVEGFISTSRFENRPVSIADSSDIYAPLRNEPVYPSAVGEEDERTFYGRTYARKEDHSSKKTIGN